MNMVKTSGYNINVQTERTLCLPITISTSSNDMSCGNDGDVIDISYIN